TPARTEFSGANPGGGPPTVVVSLAVTRQAPAEGEARGGKEEAGEKEKRVAAPERNGCGWRNLTDVMKRKAEKSKSAAGDRWRLNQVSRKPQQEQHLRSAAFLPWQERRERSDAAARSSSEQRKREYVESQHQERLAAQMTALQSAISEDWQHHACASGATRLEDSPLKPLQGMQVEYISMQDRFKLMLPCASCNQSISPNPISFFCWPSSQTHAQTWYDVRVLRSYARMQGCGVSMEAFLEALNAAHHPLALYPPQQIRTDSFSQAFSDYLRAIDRLLSMPRLLQQRSDLQAQLPRGAFSDRPICALVPGKWSHASAAMQESCVCHHHHHHHHHHTTMGVYVCACVCVHAAGVPQDGYVHCVAGGACNKPSSYAGVAKATRNLEQHTDTYLDRWRAQCNSGMTVGNSVWSICSGQSYNRGNRSWSRRSGSSSKIGRRGQ
ncbi:hypothetical protein QJQ45_016416, partial [Haematococcus lacustris]